MDHYLIDIIKIEVKSMRWTFAKPSRRIRIQLLLTQHILLNFLSFVCSIFHIFAESFKCLWVEGLCLLGVLRDYMLHLLRCWDMGQGPCLMSVLFVRADPGYSFLSPFCLCQPQQKVSVWFVHWLQWGWSKLLWASSQQFPFSGEQRGVSFAFGKSL